MTPKSLFINTMGCQMNVYDSGQIRNRLAPLGYRLTDDLSQADVIIVNTCSIRAKAEQKAFSFLGRLAPLKQQKPDLIIGIAGCVAQQEGGRILSRMPYVDLVFGTHAIARLPRNIERISATRCRIVDVRIDPQIDAGDFCLGPQSDSATAAFVTIMRGCDNYCTYCVVPHVRGREASRAPEDIESEVRHLVSQGVREVTLLGQNVNSYGLKEGLISFAQLIDRLNAVEGLERIRFTTSHPKDLSGELMEAFSRLDKLCPHIHLPVQSGSDRILKRMNRRYTRDDYLARVDALRSLNPGIAITSDIIVGFPGETNADFAATIELIHRVGFDGLFAFIYSDRPNAPANRFDGKVDASVKKERLQKVLACQEMYTLHKHQELVGTLQEILVDGISPGSPITLESSDMAESGKEIQWSGRTGTNKIVHFDQQAHLEDRNEVLTGRRMNIMIEKALPHCLWGRQHQPSKRSD
jgi:tRNA-2-methylthio-N6-dimethylallyladenosine synthase